MMWSETRLLRLILAAFVTLGIVYAIVTPIFSPYLELPVLDDYGLQPVYIKGSEAMNWQIPDEEVAKLKADPSLIPGMVSEIIRWRRRSTRPARTGPSRTPEPYRAPAERRRTRRGRGCRCGKARWARSGGPGWTAAAFRSWCPGPDACSLRGRRPLRALRAA